MAPDAAPPSFPPGKYGLRISCATFEGFEKGLCDALPGPDQVREIAAKLDLSESRWRTMENETVQEGWRRVLKLAAEEQKLKRLVELAAAHKLARAAELPSLYRSAPCQFLEWPTTARDATAQQTTDHDENVYLYCDRSREWEPFESIRKDKTAIPLIVLGHLEEAPKVFHARILRCLKKIPVTLVDWGAEFTVENRYEKLRIALENVSFGLSKKASVTDLLDAAPRFVLLHPVVYLDEQFERANKLLEDYYARLAGDLSVLSEREDYQAPFIVQCITWNKRSFRPRAEKLAEAIASKLGTVTPPPRVIQRELEMIPNDVVEGFLEAWNKSHLWPEVKKKIHVVNLGPVVLGRKPSCAVYEALEAAIANDGTRSAENT